MDRPGSAKRTSTAASIRGAKNLQIVYEDDVLVVIDKPAGLLAVPLERREDAPSVYELLTEHLRARKRRPFVVHRIDRDTSGLVVFTKDPRTQRLLREQFKRREPERVYLAVVYGHPNPPEGTWCDRLVWDTRALIMKETHPRDPSGKDAVSALPRRGIVRDDLAPRGPFAHRQAQSDPAAGAASRPYARRRAALHVRT